MRHHYTHHSTDCFFFDVHWHWHHWHCCPRGTNCHSSSNGDRLVHLHNFILAHFRTHNTHCPLLLLLLLVHPWSLHCPSEIFQLASHKSSSSQKAMGSTCHHCAVRNTTKCTCYLTCYSAFATNVTIGVARCDAIWRSMYVCRANK